MIATWVNQPAMRGGGGPPAWTPADLGSKLLGWFDAEDASTLVLAGSLVNSWKDKVTNTLLSQGISGSKPSLNPTVLNNRPGVVFDGTDDELSVASVFYPTGSTAVEVWALTLQSSAPADAGNLRLFAYGGTNTGASDSRGFARAPSDPTNSGTAIIGNGTSPVVAVAPAVDFSGRCVYRAVVSPTGTQITVNGISAGVSAVVPATNTAGITRIGGNSTVSAGSFYKGAHNSLIITQPLTGPESVALEDYLKTRGGL